MNSRSFESLERLPPLPEGAFTVKAQITERLSRFDPSCRLMQVRPENGGTIPIAIDGGLGCSPFPLSVSEEELRWLGVERLVCPNADICARLLLPNPIPAGPLEPGSIREAADILTVCGFLPNDPEAQDRFCWRRSYLKRKNLGETFTLNGSTALLLKTEAGLLFEDVATRPELRRQGKGEALVRAILQAVGKPVWVLYEAEASGFWERFEYKR